MNDQSHNPRQSDLWVSIYRIVSKLKLAPVDGDAYDIPSITSELEQLWNTRHSDPDVTENEKVAFGNGRLQFKEYIKTHHPDPDSMTMQDNNGKNGAIRIGYDQDQIVKLAEGYAMNKVVEYIKKRMVKNGLNNT